MLRASLLTGLSLILVTTSVAFFAPRYTGSTSLLHHAKRAVRMGIPVRRVTNTREEVINLNPSLSGDGRIVPFEMLVPRMRLSSTSLVLVTAQTASAVLAQRPLLAKQLES